VTEAEFYHQIAQILDCSDTYREFQFSKKTRWNNRDPGNGRFLNHGMVRRFSATLIHVYLHAPRLIGVYNTDCSALNAIKTAVSETSQKINNSETIRYTKRE
jgi:hypothetical protein